MEGGVQIWSELLERGFEVPEKAHFDVSPLINTSSSSGVLFKRTSMDIWVLPISINKTPKRQNQTGRWGRKKEQWKQNHYEWGGKTCKSATDGSLKGIGLKMLGCFGDRLLVYHEEDGEKVEVPPPPCRLTIHPPSIWMQHRLLQQDECRLKHQLNHVQSHYI